MRKGIQLIALFILILALLSCSGCISKLEPTRSYPVYEQIDSEEDGVMVNFKGVIYKMYPLTKWEVNPDGEMVGYAGTKETIICLAEGDTERNFIYLQDNGASMYYRPLYRTDRVIPAPSGESVDTITWKEYDFTGKESEFYDRQYDDKETIKRLFDVWESGEKTWEYEFLPDFRIHMLCLSFQVPGAYFDLFLVMNSSQEVMMGTPDQGYTEVPIELLEEISGRDIDVDKWIG